MDDLDYWKYCDSFSVIEAAYLLAGADPSMKQKVLAQLDPTEKPAGVDACFAALKNAVLSGNIKAIFRYEGTEGHWDHLMLDLYYSGDLDDDLPHDLNEVIYRENNGRTIVCNRYPDWNLSTISREALIEWLERRNIKPAFFFEQTTDSPPYLDPKNPNYSPKLAAAIKAWEAVTTDKRYINNGKAPKSNIESWLTSHAEEFGLVKDNGEINNDAIKKQIAKVSNWKTDGGAPKTPTR